MIESEISPARATWLARNTRHLLAVLRYVDRRQGLVLTALVVVYLSQALILAAHKRLWYDEVLGLAVASASSWQNVLALLKSGLDYNPPLYYYATRMCVLTFGEGNLSIRLPAVLGMLCFLVCLFRFAARRMPIVFAALTFMLVMIMPARNYSFEARPYGLLLGFTGVALLAYQNITAGTHRRTALWAFGFGLAAASVCHYYGIVVVLPFVVGEFVRLLRQRHADFPLWLMFLAPIAALVSVFSVMHAQRGFLHSETWSRSWREVPNAYNALFAIEGWVLILLASVLLVTCLIEDSPGSAQEVRSPTPLSFPIHELAVLLTLALLPVVGMVLAQFVTHSYIPRYFLAALAGLSLIFAALFRMLVGNRLLAPYALLFSLLAVCAVNTPRLWSYFTSLGSEFVSIEGQRFENLPIVIEDAKDMLYIWRNYPRLRSRVWFLASPADAKRIKNYDADDIAMLAYRNVVPIQIAKYQEFIHLYPHFYLFSRANTWIGWNVEALLSAGASLRLEAQLPGGGPAQTSLYIVDMDTTRAFE
jgi:hypothetical protein